MALTKARRAGGGARRGKGRRPASRSFRRLRLSLVIAALLICVGLGAFTYWYSSQEPARQRRLQEQAIASLTELRERKETGRDVDDFIGWLIQQFPISRPAPATIGEIRDDDPHTLAGIPLGGRPVRLLENLGYEVGYDEERRNPAWVAFRLIENSAGRLAERPEGFRPDGRTSAGVDHYDYTHSGYDRGHMAPNYAIGIVYGEAAQFETFLMSNIVPQKPELNRGIWRDMEIRIMDRYLPARRELWEITGPVYSGSERHLDSGVAIPDAFFLILADVDEQRRLHVLAFIVPQDAAEGGDMARYLVSVDAIEEATGFDFMSLLKDDVEDTIEARVAPRLW